MQDKPFKLHDTLKLRCVSLKLFSEGLGYTYYDGAYETTMHPQHRRISMANMIRLHDAEWTKYEDGKFTFGKGDKAIEGFTFDGWFGTRATMSKIVDRCKLSVYDGAINIEEDSKQPNNNLVRFVNPSSKEKFCYW